MYIFLNKKIAIPNNTKLRTLSWNPEHGWLACGGEDAMLKVLKLDVAPPKDTGGVRGIAAPTNLTMNQTLEGHHGTVQVAVWNPLHKKLTTADHKGLIIVWLLHKGVWFEEMINNRGKSVVADMRWRSNGQEICIAYEDGHVILGTVDGNQVWRKEMGVTLTHVEWAPDGRWLLFGSGDGPVTVYNHQGARIGNLELQAISDLDKPVRLLAIEWYDGAEGYVYPDVPCLAVAFVNGRVQIMREADDPKPVLLDTGLTLTQCKWNSAGSVLALAGSRVAAGKETSEVQFYTPFGRYITTMKVPGGAISSVTWEGGNLRLALAVESYVFFANIRPDHRWGSFGDCVVYAYTRPDRLEQSVVFWNTKTDERYIKQVKRLVSIHAAGEHCVLVTAVEPEDVGADPLSVPASTGGTGTPHAAQYWLILCNAIGSPVDSKYVDVRPDFVTMTPYHVVVASTDTLYTWQYRTAVSKLTSIDTGTSLRRKEGREKIFHIDDTSVEDAATDTKTSQTKAKSVIAGLTSGPVSDAICCVAASSKYLLVGRESGTVQQYSLPLVSLENKFTLRCRPSQIQLNCDSTRFSIIDINNVLSLFDMEGRTTDIAGQAIQGEHLAFEKKDVWQVMWAEDHPNLWAMMEKTRMYVFRDTDPEEPTLSSGYMCKFNDLKVVSVLLDDVMAQPDKPEKTTMVIEHEMRSLRDTRMLLAKNGLRDSMQFIEDNSHPRLWRLLAETALEKLDLNTAEKAFVACSDYPGIQFVKRLRILHDRNKQRAEVAVYFKRFEEAEKIYFEMDRRDLAVDMRMRLGDWHRVLQIFQTTGGGDDAILTLARQKLGDYYADRQRWKRAIPYYETARCYEALLECYYIVEDFTKLTALIDALPEGSSLLTNVGYKLQSVGLTAGAATAFQKAGDMKAAVDCCVLLNQWDQAVELAEKHKLPQIEALLAKYASHLLESNKTMTAIELYRKAGRDAESAKLLAKLASDVGKLKVNPLRAKKLYVLAALEVERHRKKNMDISTMAAAMTTSGGAANARTAAAMATQATLNTMLKADSESLTGSEAAAARTLDAAWHGAEAYHFYMLAQRQLYDGDVLAAMTSAQRLSLYEDIVDPKDVYSLIALTSYYNRCFGTCSKAFIKLEGLETIPVSDREQYSDLALAIFTDNRPVDPADDPSRQSKCPTPGCKTPVKPWAINCMTCGANFSACTASGRPIFGGDTVRCRVCRHPAFRSELGYRKSCPLCHGEYADQNAAALSTPAPKKEALSSTSGGSFKL